MINIVRVGPIGTKILNTQKLLTIESAEKYASSQCTYLKLTIKNRFYYSTVNGFTLEILEYTSSGSFIKKIKVAKKNAIFDSTYNFDEDLIIIDNDCETIEIRIIEIDYVSFSYRENGFCYIEHQKPQVSLEVGETIQTKGRRIYPKYAYLAYLLTLLVLIALIVIIANVGRY